tara:strand:- start:280 stop:1335 length:1056 start_codon:yes stop_codon:yes gene_type:complete
MEINQLNTKDLNTILSNFDINSSNYSLERINTGYINDSFYINYNGKRKYVLQKINTNVFKKIKEIKNNIALSINKLDNADYHKIHLIKTKSGDIFHSSNNKHWRLMEYVSGSYTKDNASNENDAYEAGKILSLFHILLKDEDISKYHDTLDNFHSLPYRIKEFKYALSKTSNDLKKECTEEIDYCRNMFDKLLVFYNADIPYRICHNDSKLNNILFSNTNKGLCMIDLDTIMKGYFHFDFGDAVRTIVNPASEEEQDLSKLLFNKSLFKAFIDGLKSNGKFLLKNEIDLLPLSTVLMPFIHGLRALTDYLNGNIYYKVSYPKQNLIRSRNLFTFSKLAEKNKDFMAETMSN